MKSHSAGRLGYALALGLPMILAGCGGGGGGGGSPPGGAAVALAPTPAPSSAPSPTPTPAASLLPPAPFGLTMSADFALVGWQETSNLPAPLVALAEHKGSLAWSASLKTYAVALSDLASGRLVYSFPGNNPVAFSIVQADGSTAKTHVTVRPRTDAIGDLYWSTADGVSPGVYARALFGIPIAAGSLPSSGVRVFATDTAPQSALTFDFAARKVTGTITSFNDGGAWDPPGPKEQATLEPADLQPDGSFVAVIAVPGAPRKGELRGRLFGLSGNELGVYWNAPVRDGYDGAFGEWRTVMFYPG
jgi:hypothetical protein